MKNYSARVLLFLLLGSIALADDGAPVHLLSSWKGDQIQLTATDSSVRIDLACATITARMALTLAQDGLFHAAGILRRFPVEVGPGVSFPADENVTITAKPSGGGYQLKTVNPRRTENYLLSSGVSESPPSCGKTLRLNVKKDRRHPSSLLTREEQNLLNIYVVSTPLETPGDGSSWSSPLDGSTREKFDKILWDYLSGYEENPNFTTFNMDHYVYTGKNKYVHLHLGPGVFWTNGRYGCTDAGGNHCVRDVAPAIPQNGGVVIVTGNGVNKRSTIIRLANERIARASPETPYTLPSRNLSFMPGANLGGNQTVFGRTDGESVGGLARYFEVSNLTIDCNKANQPTYRAFKAVSDALEDAMARGNQTDMDIAYLALSANAQHNLTVGQSNAVMGFSEAGWYHDLLITGAWSNNGEGFPTGFYTTQGDKTNRIFWMDRIESYDAEGNLTMLTIADQTGGRLTGHFKDNTLSSQAKANSAVTGLGAGQWDDFTVRNNQISGVGNAITIDTFNYRSVLMEGNTFSSRNGVAMPGGGTSRFYDDFAFVNNDFSVTNHSIVQDVPDEMQDPTHLILYQNRFCKGSPLNIYNLGIIWSNTLPSAAIDEFKSNVPTYSLSDNQAGIPDFCSSAGQP